MTKYTVTFDVAVYAEHPSEAIAEAIYRVATGVPRDEAAWNMSFTREHGTSAIVGAEHTHGKYDGWRLLAVVKEYE